MLIYRLWHRLRGTTAPAVGRPHTDRDVYDDGLPG